MSDRKDETIQKEDTDSLNIKNPVVEEWEREKEAVNLYGDEEDIPSFINEKKDDSFGVELEQDANITSEDGEDGYDLDDEHHVSVDMSALDEKRRSAGSQKDTDKIESLVEKGLVDKKRLIAPIALIALLVGLIVVGIMVSRNTNADKTPAQETVTASTETSGDGENAGSGLTVPDTPLTACTDQDINNLILYYYTAYATGDVTTISTLVDPATDDFLTEVKTRSQYIDSYPAINVYLKPGPVADSYLAFVYTQIMMTGYNQNVPALQTFYVCKREDGTWYINMTEELSEDVAQYIHDIDLQDDVIELNNKVTAEFNDLLAADAAFASYYTEVYGQMKAQVSQALAEDHTDVLVTEAETIDKATRHAGKQIKATAVVNMRASDSENADKVGKAQIGDVFTVIEERDNGWTNVTASDGSVVWIKSDYLELLEPDTEDAAEDTENAPANTEEGQNAADTQQTAQNDTQSTDTDNKQYVTTTTRVNVRKTASETADKLATVNEGTKLELLEKQSNGWTKVKYNDTTGFIKSDYLQ